MIGPRRTIFSVDSASTKKKQPYDLKRTRFTFLQLEEKAQVAAKELEEQKALTQSAQAETQALEKRLAALEAKFEALLQTATPEKN